jgi:hypothetical protein
MYCSNYIISTVKTGALNITQILQNRGKNCKHLMTELDSLESVTSRQTDHLGNFKSSLIHLQVQTVLDG